MIKKDTCFGWWLLVLWAQFSCTWDQGVDGAVNMSEDEVNMSEDDVNMSEDGEKMSEDEVRARGRLLGQSVCMIAPTTKPLRPPHSLAHTLLFLGR